MVDYKINEEIKTILKTDYVLLIGSDGTKIGSVPFKTALYKAQNENLDLVCINATAQTPVCKVMNYSKFKYEAIKRERANKSKQHEADTKEIQLRPQIAQHDIDTKVSKCREELVKGNNIKIVMTFKGRQVDHPEIGFNIINNIKESLKDVCIVFKDGVLDGRRVECILKPAKK